MITRSSADLATLEEEVCDTQLGDSGPSSSSSSNADNSNAHWNYRETGNTSSQGAESSLVSVEHLNAANSLEVPTLNEEDQCAFAEAVRIINDGAGDLKKLKVDHCKAYLRKYGLRLAGSKLLLLERIKEHLEIKDGGGMVKYPVSTFAINCTGDACIGDLVLFKQKVYEKFDLVSRRSTLPALGVRTVAGRIVNESYGAAKQQHTFTLEVLWSTGVRALPPLYPLIIKGRNLYRLTTVRQPWLNEADRHRILGEKHIRGRIARSTRLARIEAKKLRRLKRSRTLLVNVGSKHHTKGLCFQKTSSRGVANVKKKTFVSSYSERDGKNCTGPLSLLKMSIKSSVAGIIIGRHGTKVKEISGATGAKLNIREDKLNPRMSIVEIRGKSGQAELARKMIVENLKKRGFSL